MALIKCPECGKENVSDSAEMCPACGYGIKEHFDLMKQKQMNQEIYQRRIESVIMPESPKKMNFGYGMAIFAGIVGVLEFFVSPVMAIILVLSACWMYYEGSKQYNKEMEKYNLALTDFEKYQQKTVQEEEYKAIIESMKPKCPACGSTSILKITAMDRIASISVFGAASGKIGKQYKCRKCKHMW